MQSAVEKGTPAGPSQPSSGTSISSLAKATPYPFLTRATTFPKFVNRAPQPGNGRQGKGQWGVTPPRDWRDSNAKFTTHSQRMLSTLANDFADETPEEKAKKEYYCAKRCVLYRICFLRL